jgi:hypothetical protein
LRIPASLPSDPPAFLIPFERELRFFQQNDRPAAIKRHTNEGLGSEIIEDKSYRPTDSALPSPGFRSE